MSKVVGYLRVSTAAQAESRNGLRAQKDAIKKGVKKLHLGEPIWFSDEGVSGGKSLEDRPGLMDAVASIERGDVLAVLSRDRLGRDALEMALIEKAVQKKGGKIMTADGGIDDQGDPHSRLMRQILDVFAEFERGMIQGRTRRALEAKKARREVVGTVCYGQKLSADGKHVEDHQEERAVIDMMTEWRWAGLSYHKIADKLNDMGVPTKSGKGRWGSATVMKIVKRADAESKAA